MITLIISNILFVFLFFRERSKRVAARMQIEKREQVQRLIVKKCLQLFNEKEYLINEPYFSIREKVGIELLRYLRDSDFSSQEGVGDHMAVQMRFPKFVLEEFPEMEEIVRSEKVIGK